MSGGTPFEEDDQSHHHHHELENVYDVWIATRSKLRGYSTVVFDRLQRVLLLFGSEEERRREGEKEKKEEKRTKEVYDRSFSCAGVDNVLVKPFKWRNTSRGDSLAGRCIDR